MPSDDAIEAFANTEKTFFELASEQRLAIIFQLNEMRPKRPRKGGPTLTLEPTYDFAGTEKSIESRLLRNREKGLAYYHRHRQEVNEKRKVRYRCRRCSVTFSGSGSWKTARQHSEDFGHAMEVLRKS